MGKIRYTYRGYDSATMKTRSSIPAATDITTAAYQIDCVNIIASSAYTVVGATSYQLSQICTASGVNHWSAYGPTKRTMSATSYSGQLINSDPTTAQGFSLGEYAGYNHNAVAPHWESGGSNEEWWVLSGDTTIIDCIIDIGEILYSDITPTSGVSIAFSVWNGATMISSVEKALSSTGVTNLIDFSTSSTTGNKGGRIEVALGTGASMTLTCKAEILKNTPYNYDGSNTLGGMTAQIPNWTVKLHKIAANILYLDAPSYYVAGVSSGWAWSTPTFNTSGAGAGVFGAQYIGCFESNGSSKTVSAGIKGYVEAWDNDASTGYTMTYDHVILTRQNTTGIDTPSHDLWQTEESGGDLPHTGYITAGGNVYQPLTSGYGYRIHIHIY